MIRLVYFVVIFVILDTTTREYWRIERLFLSINKCFCDMYQLLAMEIVMEIEILSLSFSLLLASEVCVMKTDFGFFR